MSDIKDKLTDHEYDGIKEYDNPLPRWWLLTFYMTIVFAVIYYGYFEMGSGNSIAKEYEIAKAELDKAAPAAAPAMDANALAEKTKNPAVIAAGKEVFAAKCAACHAPDGGGLVGPNLTDNYWIHGDGSATAVSKVIREGVPEKGMLAWQTLLKEDELVAVTAFVVSLKGSKPANPKAPQGNEIK